MNRRSDTNLKKQVGALLEYIQSDLFRYYGNSRARTAIGAFVLNPSFNYTVWLRLAQSDIPVGSKIARIIHSWKSRRSQIHIPVETVIGYGLYIAHGMPLVVNPTARIGNNCNLSQFVTIGSNHGQAATIGDNVYIGPGVCIVENVTVGANSTIGAGAVVVKDVPEGTTVAGVPATVIGKNRHSSYIGNRWPPQQKN